MPGTPTPRSKRRSVSHLAWPAWWPSRQRPVDLLPTRAGSRTVRRSRCVVHIAHLAAGAGELQRSPGNSARAGKTCPRPGASSAAPLPLLQAFGDVLAPIGGWGIVSPFSARVKTVFSVVFERHDRADPGGKWASLCVSPSLRPQPGPGPCNTLAPEPGGDKCLNGRAAHYDRPPLCRQCGRRNTARPVPGLRHASIAAPPPACVDATSCRRVRAPLRQALAWRRPPAF